VTFHDETIDFTRPLQGQSPYVINGTLSFQEPNLGMTLTLVYNTFGERVMAVGSKYGNRYINLYEEPRDLIDLSINQKIVWDMELKFMVKNVTGQDRHIYIDTIEENGKTLYEQVPLSPSYGFQLSKTI
jgi:hypothetical protein